MKGEAPSQVCERCGAPHVAPLRYARGGALSVEEAEDLAARLLAARLLVVDDAGRRREHDVAELARREQVVDLLLDVCDLDVKARRHDAALVDAAAQVDDDLARAVVVDDLEVADVACAGGGGRAGGGRGSDAVGGEMVQRSSREEGNFDQSTSARS